MTTPYPRHVAAAGGHPCPLPGVPLPGRRRREELRARSCAAQRSRSLQVCVDDGGKRARGPLGERRAEQPRSCHHAGKTAMPLAANWLAAVTTVLLFVALTGVTIELYWVRLANAPRSQHSGLLGCGADEQLASHSDEGNPQQCGR
eukprot:scaffold2083_cov419-Prasinococcus_capsulatus_cf.AAC.11